MTRPRPIRQPFVVAATAILLAVTGCSTSDSDTSPVAAPAATPTVTPTLDATQAALARVDAGDYTYAHHEWHFVGNGGYEFTLSTLIYDTLGQGVAVHTEAGELDPVGMGCDWNARTDALFPFSLSIGDASGAAETPVAFAIGFEPPDGAVYDGAGLPPAPSDERIRVAWTAPGPDNTDKTGCQLLSSNGGRESYFPLTYPEPFTPQSSGRVYGYLVVADYYTPATPNGDSALLRYLTLHAMVRPVDRPGLAYLIDEDGVQSAFSAQGVTLSDVSGTETK